MIYEFKRNLNFFTKSGKEVRAKKGERIELDPKEVAHVGNSGGRNFTTEEAPKAEAKSKK